MREAIAPEGLAGKLARYPGPRYRKAYLADLLASGDRFQQAGNARGAGYCYAKVAEALSAVADMDENASTKGMGLEPADPEAGTEISSEPPAGPAQDAQSGPNPGPEAPPAAQPRAERAKPKEKPLSPTERFRRQWRLERLKDAENVLLKHGNRLSVLENNSYRDRLEKLRLSGQAAHTSAQSDKADAGLLELRRRLYQRVLKSQQLSLSRQRMPVTLARLALPPAHPGSRFGEGKPAFSSPGASAVEAESRKRKSLPAPNVRVKTEWQPATGPYNDRYNIEDVLSLIADADAAWVQEFLDLFRGLAGLQGLANAIAAGKK